MSQSLSKSLTKCLIDTIIAIEYSNGIIVDEDTAVGIMEQISDELQKLSSLDKTALINLVNQISQQYPIETANFVKSIPDTFGITD